MSEELPKCVKCGWQFRKYYQFTCEECGEVRPILLDDEDPRNELKEKIAESKAKIVAEVNRLRRLKKELRELG